MSHCHTYERDWVLARVHWFWNIDLMCMSSLLAVSKPMHEQIVAEYALHLVLKIIGEWTSHTSRWNYYQKIFGKVDDYYAVKNIHIMHLSQLCPTLPGWWVGRNFEGGLTLCIHSAFDNNSTSLQHRPTSPNRLCAVLLALTQLSPASWLPLYLTSTWLQLPPISTRHKS